MAKAQVVHRFNTSADRLWSLIGDFANTGKWSGRPAKECRCEGQGIGALRTLKMADEREIIDRLVDQGPLFYSYEIVSSPLPVSSYRARMSVQPVSDNECEFTWSGEIVPAGISDEHAVAFFEKVYRQAIAMMHKQLD